MNAQLNAELIWLRGTGGIELVVRPERREGQLDDLPSVARTRHGGPSVPIRKNKVREPIVHRVPTTLTITDNRAMLGEIYAILAGESTDGFSGGRLNFRDIMDFAKSQRAFIYVIPTNRVQTAGVWNGYIRLGHKRWISLPCPLPEAVYNRIPTRALERRPSTVRAREVLQQLGIPMFNPEYFSKWRIYEILNTNNLGDFLPDTSTQLTEQALNTMLKRHTAVYLKPSGGSVGHGMLRVELAKGGWQVATLKNSQTRRFPCANFQEVWSTVKRERVAGRYVIQQAIPLLEYRGHPCDFRVLLQKANGNWRVVGRGVRVSGNGRITTHVPNGGSIANADNVLRDAFAGDAKSVASTLEQSALRAARAIDQAYRGELGEMSMDIGIDAQGRPWFFEANAKPMKFDEPDIRRKSLEGVLTQLRDRAEG